jgi:hypothetical protein
MKLIEVVVLTGMQCISPTQTSPAMTEAHKVWCAVIVEGDSETRNIDVTPETMTGEPSVKSALSRMQTAWNLPPKAGVPQSGMRVVAAAPPPAAPMPVAAPAPVAPAKPPLVTAVTKIAKTPDALPQVENPVPTSDSEPAADETSVIPQPTEQVAEAAIDPPQIKPDSPVATSDTDAPDTDAAKKKTKAKKRSDVCRNGTRAVWYTNSEGRRKYRCRRGDA